MVVLHLPAARQLQLLVGEHVEEGHQVPVVLVALKVVSVPPHLADHVLQTGVGGEHAVGTLSRDREKEELYLVSLSSVGLKIKPYQNCKRKKADNCY